MNTSAKKQRKDFFGNTCIAKAYYLYCTISAKGVTGLIERSQSTGELMTSHTCIWSIDRSAGDFPWHLLAVISLEEISPGLVPIATNSGIMKRCEAIYCHLALAFRRSIFKTGSVKSYLRRSRSWDGDWHCHFRWILYLTDSLASFRDA